MIHFRHLNYEEFNYRRIKNANHKPDFSSQKVTKSTLLDTGVNDIGRKTRQEISKLTGSGLMLTNSQIKYIMKIITTLENRGVFLK